MTLITAVLPDKLRHVVANRGHLETLDQPEMMASLVRPDQMDNLEDLVRMLNQAIRLLQRPINVLALLLLVQEGRKDHLGLLVIMEHLVLQVLMVNQVLKDHQARLDQMVKTDSQDRKDRLEITENKHLAHRDQKDHLVPQAQLVLQVLLESLAMMANQVALDRLDPLVTKVNQANLEAQENRAAQELRAIKAHPEVVRNVHRLGWHLDTDKGRF